MDTIATEAAWGRILSALDTWGKRLQAEEAKGSGRAMDTCKATPELFAALAQAQADVESVGKDGTNTQRGYRYATTEAMIRGSRQHLASHGLAFLSTWAQSLPEVAPGDIGKQHVAARVTIHWVLGHASGGQIHGTAHMDAISSPARPPDKAVAAAVTYGLGFVLRGLLLLDRADEDEHSPDKRQEPEPDRLWMAFETKRDRVASVLGVRPERAQERILAEAEIAKTRDWTDPEVERMIAAADRLLAPPREEAPAESLTKPANGKAAKSQDPTAAAHQDFLGAYKAYKDECQAQGLQPVPWLEIAGEAIGKPWSTEKGAHGPEDWQAAAAACRQAIQRLREGGEGGAA